MHDAVIESAVGLDVTDVGAGIEERRELGCEPGSQHLGIDVEGAAPEVLAVIVGRVRADRDAVVRGAGDALAHGCGIPRMKPTRDIRARHEGKHRVVVGRRGAPPGLTQVAVEVDRHAPKIAPFRGPNPDRA